MRFSIPGIFGCFVLTLYAGLAARAADPQSYRVDMASTGDGSMDATLRATSELEALRDTAPVSPFGLIARARGEVDRLKTVLESYGYYQAAVTITIESLGLGSAGLAAALTALPKDQSARVAISFNLGPLYHLRKVDIEGTVPESARGAFTLKAGAPAIASDVLAAGARLLTALQEQGYAFAKVDPPVAYEDQSLPVLDVSFRVDAGARATIGEIRFEGLQRVHEKLVRRRLTLRPGRQYSPTAIEAARRDLLSLGPFAAISVEVGKAVDSTGGVPVTFTLRERKRHAVALNAAYSTDLGGSGGVTWSDRNVFGNAEQLTVAASALNLGGSATTGIGYDTSAKFLKPEFGHRDQALQIAVGAIKQSLQAYDQKAVTTGVTLTRKLSSVWTVSAGVSTSNEQVIQETNTPQYNALAPTIPLYPAVTYNYTLVALPLTLSYDSTHLASPLDDPVHGMRDSLSITPTQSLGHPNASFVISQVKLAAYFDLHGLGFTDPGRSVLAVRALAGEARGAGEFSLPPDQRFYGGGSGTIRGYRYQSVGPQFPADGNPIGGTAIIAGTLEFRQRIAANWGAAAFVDGGQVSSSLKPLRNELRIGYGVGARYYTPIGPIRLDIAVPTQRHSFITSHGVVQTDANGVITGVTSTTGVVRDDAFEIYIGLGQAF
jgi:translocation and assembly module TamA